MDFFEINKESTFLNTLNHVIDLNINPIIIIDNLDNSSNYIIDYVAEIYKRFKIKVICKFLLIKVKTRDI